VAQLYPRTLGSIFVVSYDPQGCGGGIRTRLHTGMFYYRSVRAAFISLRFDFLSCSEVLEVTTSLTGGAHESLSHGCTVVSMYKKTRACNSTPSIHPNGEVVNHRTGSIVRFTSSLLNSIIGDLVFSQMAVKLSALRAGRSLPPRRIPGTHFCQRLCPPQGHSAAGRIRSIEESNDLIGNRTRDLPACSIVPQPTTYHVPPVNNSTYNTHP
jgi:hypothetical protein